MKLYSFKNASYLKTYYSPKIIDQIVDPKTLLRITSIEIKEVNKDLFKLICHGYFINNSSVNPSISIESVIQMMSLNPPELVLEHRDL